MESDPNTAADEAIAVEPSWLEGRKLVISGPQSILRKRRPSGKAKFRNPRGRGQRFPCFHFTFVALRWRFRIAGRHN